MFPRNIFFLIFSYFLLLNSLGSDVIQKNTDHVTEISENLQKSLDYKEHREFAQKYLNKLAEVKENWIDPFDMIGYPAQQRTKAPPEPQDEEIKHGDQSDDVRVEPSNAPKQPNSVLNEQTEVPQFIPPELDNDEKPIFSKINGGYMIDHKIYDPDEATLNFNTKDVRSFTRSNHICVLDAIYISRWLNKVVTKIEKENYFIPSTLNIPIDKTLFENLKELSTAKTLETSQMDELISKMIDHSFVVRVEDFDWSILSDYAKDIIWPFAIFMIVAVCTYTIYLGILSHPLFTTLLCIIVSSIFWHWMHLYKQREAVKLAELSSMTIPAQCRKHEFGLIEHFHEYLKSFFTSNECAKYYEALTVDPFWEVSITVAISEAVTSMLFQPLSVSSRYLNLAIKQLFDGLSVFMVIPLLIFLFLLLIMLCNYRIRFPFFMGALEPNAPPGGSRVQDLVAVNETAMREVDSKCNRFMKGKGGCSQKSLAQGADVHMGTCDASKCRNQKCIKNCSEEQDMQPEMKDLSDAELNLSSRSSSALDQSVSEDDISIIDSEENDSDSENSVMEQVAPDCDHSCHCCHNVEYLPNVECKACDDNLARQNTEESFHLSPESHGSEDNAVR